MATETETSRSTTYQEARETANKYLAERLAAGKNNTTEDENFVIPIVDISSTFSGTSASKKEAAAQIRTACTTSGFFYITGHGVTEASKNGILEQAQRFFAELSREQKEDLSIKKSKLGYGYEAHGDTSIAGDVETKEGFNFGYEAGMDKTGGDGKYKNLDGTTYNGNLWPKETDLAGFHLAVKEYYEQILELARHLFRLFALSLDLPEDHFDSMTTHPGGIARLLYYPPAKKGEEEVEEEVGLGAHSDYECFTLLLSSAAPGLEILSPSGQWHRAQPVEGSFIVNVADFLMRWTNGVYKSTIHRVVNRGTEARYSVPFFFSVNYDTMVETLLTCLKEGEKPKYPPIRAGEYILERLNATTKDGKGFYGAQPVFEEKA